MYCSRCGTALVDESAPCPNCGAVHAAARRAAPLLRRFKASDLILDRYRVAGELGRGGMGVVYRCRDEVGGIHVALKALPPELSCNPFEMEQVRENFQLVSRLIHQNIAAVRTLEQDAETGDYYLILECVEGVDLRRWQRRRGGRVELAELLPVLRQVAEALDFSHRQKIIHRDIKPSNVMVRGDGLVKVLDFGLAAQIHTSLSRVSQVRYGVAGTAPYMAPEQWRGRCQDGATDQYALGVMAYELLAGRLPFESHEESVLRAAVLHEEPEPIETLPDAAWSALARALSKERTHRFSSCGAFVEALDGGAQKKRRRPAEPVHKVSPPGLEAFARKIPQPVGGEPRHKVFPADLPKEGPLIPPKAPPAPAVRFPRLGAPYENSLGMKFVPVPGTDVLFCIWETRVKDYATYARANPAVDESWEKPVSLGMDVFQWVVQWFNRVRGVRRSWENPVYRGQRVTPSEDCPVVNVSWKDAERFCEWLTRKERNEGRLGPSQSYRLPKDWEWSVAVGLNEPRSGTPKDNDGKIEGQYPWGTEWPPPRGAGNYADETAAKCFGRNWIIGGYDDGYATTSPVGSFKPNQFGLYDLGGNVWEWCEDRYDQYDENRVLRGGSWASGERKSLLSSLRHRHGPYYRLYNFGFRCVLVVGGARRDRRREMSEMNLARRRAGD